MGKVLRRFFIHLFGEDARAVARGFGYALGFQPERRTTPDTIAKPTSDTVTIAWQTVGRHLWWATHEEEALQSRKTRCASPPAERPCDSDAGRSAGCCH